MPRNDEKIITKYDFFNYFKKPYIFWFLNNKEIDDFFMEFSMQEHMDDINVDDLGSLLKEVDSDGSLFFSNFLKLNKLLNEKLVHAYQKKFNLSFLSFHDYSSKKEGQTQKLIELLHEDRDLFIYKPTFLINSLSFQPTVVYKYKGKIYVIEHVWSTSLKKETLATFIWYQYIFKEHLGINVDQYLISYLSSQPSPEMELLVEVGNLLPFTSKKRQPESKVDEKMKNVNTYFGLKMDYRNSLYELFMSKSEYNSLNHEEWDFENYIYPSIVVEELRDFLKKEDRKINFDRIANNFLENKKSIVSPDAAIFKMTFKHCYEDFKFSSIIVPLEKVIINLLRCDCEKKRLNFLSYISDMKFLDIPKDQDYLVFKDAIGEFYGFKRRTIKIYYDFETVSFPFPFLPNTKPYMQIVLQLSLIKTIEGKETKTTNIIIDPLTLKIDNFKEIIDAIYTDELDVAYVVYNKSFENTRLKEMASLINEPDYTEKVISIIDRTVDLANWFTFGSNPFLIHKKLQGFHSIKKVIKLIPKELEQKTGTVQYSDLTRCKNGIMAQSLLLSRALVSNAEEDEENWNKNKGFMYSYCENDVRSMIAVELFIEQLIDQNKYELYKKEKYLDEKLKTRRSLISV